MAKRVTYLLDTNVVTDGLTRESGTGWQGLTPAIVWIHVRARLVEGNRRAGLEETGHRFLASMVNRSQSGPLTFTQAPRQPASRRPCSG